MSRLVVALIATTVLVPVVGATSVLAADMPVKAPAPKAAKLPYDWSGLYLGGHIGYMRGRTRVEEDGVVTEPNAATNGTVGGVLLGYNWQSGPVVFGVEGDFGWTNAHGTGLAVIITTTVSGLIVAGLGSWLLVRALARTGALSRFAAGREARGTAQA